MEATLASLVEELDKLKKTVEGMSVAINLLAQGGIIQNKRLDSFDSWLMTTSKLAMVSSDLIVKHLAQLREALADTGAVPSPEPKEVKKENHPEFA